MFDFLRRSGARAPSDAILHALQADGLPPGKEGATLRVVEQRGSYSGRKVTYFRVVDAVQAAAHGAEVARGVTYRDLDAHPDLVLRSGHVERDGTVVLTRAPASAHPPAPSREWADRAAHADDEQVVFPSEGR